MRNPSAFIKLNGSIASTQGIDGVQCSWCGFDSLQFAGRPKLHEVGDNYSAHNPAQTRGNWTTQYLECESCHRYSVIVISFCKAIVSIGVFPAFVPEAMECTSRTVVGGLDSANSVMN